MSDHQFPTQAVLIDQAAPNSHQISERLALFLADGSTLLAKLTAFEENLASLDGRISSLEGDGGGSGVV